MSFCLLFTSDDQLSGDIVSLLVISGVIVVMMSSQLYCMMTGALLPLKDKMDEVVGLSCVMAVLALVGLVVHIRFDGMGMGDDPAKVWMDLIQIVFFTFHALIYWIAKRRDQKESA